MPELRRLSLRKRRNNNNQNQTRTLTIQNNSNGLLSFPAEILLEIVNHLPLAVRPFPSQPIYAPLFAGSTFGPEGGTCRSQTIRTLCQVCKTFHRLFYPYMWRNIELLCSQYPTTERTLPGSRNTSFERWEKDLARRLLKLFELAGEYPALANQVETLNVLVTKYSQDLVVAEIAENLSLFPNLQSLQLQITFIPNNVALRIKGIYDKAFTATPASFTSIRSLAIISEQFVLVGMCPNLERLQVTRPPRLIMDGRWPVLPHEWTTAPGFPGEKIRFLRIPHGLAEIKAITGAMPNLITLELDELISSIDTDNMMALKQSLNYLSHLKALVRFDMTIGSLRMRSDDSTNDERHRVARTAREVLDKLPRVVGGQMKYDVALRECGPKCPRRNHRLCAVGYY